MERFQDVLCELMAQNGTGVTRLHKLTEIPKPTINKWRSGRTKQPQNVEDVIKIMIALHLGRADADRLLIAAGFTSVEAERERAIVQDMQSVLSLLDGWQEQNSAVLDVPQPPPQIDDFIGRKSQIDRLLTLCKTRGVYIIHGMGGTGKTTLALHIAYQLKSHFKDGILWGDLGQTWLSDRSADEENVLPILNSFIAAYKGSVANSGSLSTQYDAFRQLIIRKQALIILDDVPTTRIANYFLPSSDSTSVVLITTKNSSLLSSTHHKSARIKLAPFPEETGRN